MNWWIKQAQDIHAGVRVQSGDFVTFWCFPTLKHYSTEVPHVCCWSCWEVSLMCMCNPNAQPPIAQHSAYMKTVYCSTDSVLAIEQHQCFRLLDSACPSFFNICLLAKVAHHPDHSAYVKQQNMCILFSFLWVWLMQNLVWLHSGKTSLGCLIIPYKNVTPPRIFKIPTTYVSPPSNTTQWVHLNGPYMNSFNTAQLLLYDSLWFFNLHFWHFYISYTIRTPLFIDPWG